MSATERQLRSALHRLLSQHGQIPTGVIVRAILTVFCAFFRRNL